MATVKVNGNLISDAAIVAIYIDSDGRLIAATKLNELVNITSNDIVTGGAVALRNSNEKYLECNLEVSLKPAENELSPQTVSTLRVCYDRLGNRIPCP